MGKPAVKGGKVSSLLKGEGLFLSVLLLLMFFLGSDVDNPTFTPFTSKD